MASKFLFVLVGVLLVVLLVSSSHATLRHVHKMDMKHEPIGKFSSCGSVPFNITWSPEPISPSQPLKVFINFTLPHTLDEGTYDATIWFHGDPNPFLEFTDNFDCGDVKKFAPCPIHGGLHIMTTKTFEHIPNLGSYPGDYDVKLSIKNKKGQEMICMKGHIIIMKN